MRARLSAPNIVEDHAIVIPLGQIELPVSNGSGIVQKVVELEEELRWYVNNCILLWRPEGTPANKRRRLSETTYLLYGIRVFHAVFA